MLIKPISKYIVDKDLIIIPSGPLHYLPFEVLISDSTGRDFRHLPYLINDHSIQYAYSARLWKELNKPVDRALDILAFAPMFNESSSLAATETEDPLLADASLVDTVRGKLTALNGAEKEIRFLRERFSGKYLSGSSATEDQFKMLVSNHGILHLATHGLVDDAHPMNSRLLFSPSDTTSDEDASLYAWELYGMQLRSEMAVLSACNTGFGKLNRGEGVMSLGRAFIYAGVSGIVMSLWPAQDQTTANIMTDFYQGLTSGLSRDRALRETKLNYLTNASKNYSHPFYWAGFIVQGNSQAISIQNKSVKMPWVISGILLLVIPFIWFISRRYRS